MGGNGVESDGWRVGSGPFAFADGNWPIAHSGPALLRRFGFAVPTPPTPEDVALAMAKALHGADLGEAPPISLHAANECNRAQE